MFAHTVLLERTCRIFHRNVNGFVTSDRVTHNLPDGSSLIDRFEVSRNGLSCIHRRFASIAAQYPQHIAMRDGSTSLSYRTCNERANGIADQLRRIGVRKGDVIGLYSQRSSDAVVGMLAILKTGGIYLPLDPNYPAERLNVMLGDAGATHLLTDRPLLRRFLDFSGPTLDLSSRAGSDSYGDSFDDDVMPDDVAYIMYTSGSTGRPKGVAVSHHSVANLVIDTNFVQLGPEDTVAQAATLSFDAATFEVWGALLNGAQLVFCPQATLLSPRDFTGFLVDEKITTLWLTAALFNEIARADTCAFASLQTLIVGGEALDVRTVRSVLEAQPPRRLLNGYGPTETTTFACTHQIAITDTNELRIPIGRPIAGVRTYVLDADRQRVPPGIPGELYIGGAGVAFGYVGDPALTSDRFIRDIFTDDPRARMYRTGDRVCTLPDGTIDIIGRVDRQIKLRGYRIELDEIEAALRADERVESSIVLVEGDAHLQRILAFVVPRAAKDIAAAASIKASLAERLPEYMMPASLHCVDRLPLDANGKIDRRSLLHMQVQKSATPTKPANILQMQLVDIWQQILETSPIGIHDDFFELGGHSLLAARMLAHVENLTGVRVPREALFGRATISALSEALATLAFRAAPEALRTIRSAGNQPAFFFLHGSLAGDGFYCQRLADALGPDQPFYSVAPHGVDGRPIPDTVEAMAADYVELVKRSHPSGPYRLGGFCNGGLVAFEMARQLVAHGDIVDRVILVDAVPYGARYEWLKRLLNRFADVGLSIWQRQRLLAALSRRMDAIVTSAPSGPADFWQMLRGSVFQSRTPLNALFSEETHAGVDLEERVRVITRAYVPGRYPGRIGILFSEEVRGEVVDDPTLGWGRLSGHVDLQHIPGDHLGSVSLHTEAVAERMRAMLKDDGTMPAIEYASLAFE
jgi:amino acid adenylation domain-containing protein